MQNRRNCHRSLAAKICSQPVILSAAKGLLVAKILYFAQNDWSLTDCTGRLSGCVELL